MVIPYPTTINYICLICPMVVPQHVACQVIKEVPSCPAVVPEVPAPRPRVLGSDQGASHDRRGDLSQPVEENQWNMGYLNSWMVFGRENPMKIWMIYGYPDCRKPPQWEIPGIFLCLIPTMNSSATNQSSRVAVPDTGGPEFCRQSLSHLKSLLPPVPELKGTTGYS